MSQSSAASSGQEDLRYPLGRFRAPDPITAENRAHWIGEIESLPDGLKKAVSPLTESQLEQSYRPGGWTVRQVVHHVADSHMNSYVRFRLALTEDSPVIKPYREAAWAELADARVARVEVSLDLLAALHVRWALLLGSLKSADFRRVFIHPERGEMTLENALGLYAWHGRHHLEQITRLGDREGWSATGERA